MAKLTINTFLTLDGVMQAPGGPDEDREGGFEHGGWSVPFSTDEQFGEAMTEWMDRAGGLLLGRKTYQIFAGYWPHVTDPTADVLNRLPKYVASKTLDKVEWNNSTLLEGDVAEAVARAQAPARPGDPGPRQRQPGADADPTRPHRRVPPLVHARRLGHREAALRGRSRAPGDAARRHQDHELRCRVHIYERAGAVEYGSFALEDQ